MRLARLLRIIFGLAALALSLLALGDILLHGRLSLVSPATLVGLIAIVIAMVLHGFMVVQQRADDLRRKTAQFAATSAELEQSLKNASSMNGRLHESEQRYKGLVDSQGDAIFRRAADSRLTYANDAFFKLFGLTPQEMIGQPFTPDLHPDCRTSMFGTFTGQESGVGRVRYDQHLRTAYGWRWIAWEDYAIRDAFGRLVEVQSVGRDITERKALEDALTEARDRAEAGSRAKSGFLATMSHEIRTPMNGVLGMARLLLETDLKADQRAYVEAIHQSGESLLTLIGDILDFSKIESGMMALEEDEVDLRSLIETLVELLGIKAHGKGIEILSIIDAQVPHIIRADGLRLRQILTNLVGNAIKFTEQGGVTLRVSLVPGTARRFLRFDICDTGVGVDESKREDIFSEFVQADSSHARRFGGSGLGLAISKRLVGAMGGEIGISTVENGGSLFWFTLPSFIVQAAPPGFEHALTDLKIGILSHNDMLRDGLCSQVITAGGVAITDHTQDHIDVVLVDAGHGDQASPDYAALQKFNAYKNKQSNTALPAIILITPQMRGELDALKAQGFTSYLIKPLRHASLVKRLHESFGRISLELPPLDSDYIQNLRSQSRSQAPGTVSNMPGRNGLKILLAEDNPINALLTRELLRRRGHHIHEVVSGEDAVQAMQQNAYDLLLTDIHMPGVDGVEAARMIRAEEQQSGRPRTPIVALTADVLETGKQACSDAGMDGFITKPIDPAELDAMLATLFPAAQEERAGHESGPRHAA